MKMRIITWEEISEAVDILAIKINSDSKLVPIPRGGLIPSVMLSHKKQMSIGYQVDHEQSNTLIDDILDGGKTAKELFILWKDRYDLAVLFINENILDSDYKSGFNNLYYAKTKKYNEWLILPWENKERAIEDYEQYIATH